ncbi:hypothetical protein [Pectobacterium aroidearum]|uniref:hypothetical protein n=1 Tax=Pectobacterium aroidearum TaxID=1201031 RepID=UPI00301AA2D8
MKVKMELLKKIGLHPLCPRWMKILILQLTMNEIESEFKKLFANVDASKITPEKREEINALIAKMNKARGVEQ